MLKSRESMSGMVSPQSWWCSLLSAPAAEAAATRGAKPTCVGSSPSHRVRTGLAVVGRGVAAGRRHQATRRRVGSWCRLLSTSSRCRPSETHAALGTQYGPHWRLRSAGEIGVNISTLGTGMDPLRDFSDACREELRKIVLGPRSGAASFLARRAEKE